MALRSSDKFWKPPPDAEERRLIFRSLIAQPDYFHLLPPADLFAPVKYWYNYKFSSMASKWLNIKLSVNYWLTRLERPPSCSISHLIISTKSVMFWFIDSDDSSLSDSFFSSDIKPFGDVFNLQLSGIGQNNNPVFQYTLFR